MKVVGLTGGIGSGKTTVAEMFKELGVPVYIADTEAKKIMLNPDIREKIEILLGEETYENNSLNTAYIASKVFNDKTLLNELNAIVHPAVALHFDEWLKSQKGTYVIKEAAILFENGNYKNCDKTILVTASRDKRVQRVIHRDNTSAQSVEERMRNQWSDLKKIKLADEVITNDAGIKELKQQVYTIHHKLMNLYK